MSLAVIMLVTSPSSEPDSTVTTLAWPIKPDTADEFARLMTERFGQPSAEGLSTRSAAEAVADQRDDILIWIRRDGDHD